MVKKIAFVPLRGGSKSIPFKNIKLFCDKPLAFWVINEFNKLDDIEKIFISTDSKIITDVVKNFNINKLEIFKRNSQNAQDDSTTEAAVLEFINKMKNYLTPEDIFILVQATSPFTRSDDFKGGLEIINSKRCDSVFSCTKFKRFIWNYNGEPINYDFKDRPRRQNFNGALLENGAFYISRVKDIIKSKNRLSGKIFPYIMPDYSALEIDEEDDWIMAEQLMKIKFKNYNRKSPKELKLFITDVDGVLTDAGMYYSENGDELKKFNTRDGLGLSLLKDAGIKTAIITTENTNIVANRAKKMKLDYLYQGITNKVIAAREICKKERINFNNVAFIGDDINDLGLLKLVGYSACPQDAQEDIKSIVDYICIKKGGQGCIREITEKIISQNY